MELGKGCRRIEEQENGDFIVQATDSPDPRIAPYPVVLIKAINIDALINHELWYILQVNRYIPISAESMSNIGQISSLRYFANKEKCKILKELK